MSKKLMDLGTTRLTNSSFAELHESLLGEVKSTGPEVLKVAQWATEYETQLTVMDMLVKRQTSYIETPRIVQLDVTRDAWWKVYWHTLEFLQRLSPTDELYQHVLVLWRMAQPYKGMHEHALLEQSKEMDSFLKLAMSPDEPYAQSLQKVGLTTCVKLMMAANAEMHTEMSARQGEMAERVKKYMGLNTEEVREQMVATWSLIAQRVEAVVNLTDDAEVREKCEGFIDKCNAILNQFRILMANTHKTTKKEDGGEPEAEAAADAETAAE